MYMDMSDFKLFLFGFNFYLKDNNGYICVVTQNAYLRFSASTVLQVITWKVASETLKPHCVVGTYFW